MLSKTLKALTAFLVAALATMTLAAPAGANYTKGVDINLSVVNNAGIAVSAAYCPNGHVSLAYQWGSRHDPCNVTPFVTTLHRNGGRFDDYTANPTGVVVRASGYNTLYFYARNPSIGRPYIIFNGHKTTFVEGQLSTLHVAGATVRLHRRGDANKHKQMIIEIVSMGHA